MVEKGCVAGSSILQVPSHTPLPIGSGDPRLIPDQQESENHD